MKGVSAVSAALAVLVSDKAALPLVAVGPVAACRSDGLAAKISYVPIARADQAAGFKYFRIPVEDAAARERIITTLRELRQIVRLFDDEGQMQRFCENVLVAVAGTPK